MCDLDDSLTEIDWLNSLRIKKANEQTGGTSILLNNHTERSVDVPLVSTEKSYSVRKCNGHEKPSYSYAYLIKLAIESSKSNRMKLSEIYSWIMDKFPYYRYIETESNKGWKNAIRHNLSLNKVFKRCPKNMVESGKGSYWTVDSDKAKTYIQSPPMKKVKISNLGSTNNQISIAPSDNSINTYSSNMYTNSNYSNDIDLSKNQPLIFLNSDSMGLDIHTSDMIKQLNSDRSAFVPYSTHNSNTYRISEASNSACEISYSDSARYSSCFLQTPSMTCSNYSQRYFTKDKQCKFLDRTSNNCGLNELFKLRQPKNNLEIENDDTENGKNDVILKTPVLSQFNAETDIKDTTDESCLLKFPKLLGFSHDLADTIFDTNSLYDSFLSIHHSIFESETFESRHIIPTFRTEKKTCHEISFSHKLLLTKSQFNKDDFHSQNNEDQSDFDDIVPSQEFIDMKNHLRCHRFKSTSLTDSNKPSSVSTSSTVKSTDTVKSQSPTFDKTVDIGTSKVINSKDVRIIMDEISRSQLSEDDDDVDDSFNWGTFL